MERERGLHHGTGAASQQPQRQHRRHLSLLKSITQDIPGRGMKASCHAPIIEPPIVSPCVARTACAATGFGVCFFTNAGAARVIEPQHTMTKSPRLGIKPDGGGCKIKRRNNQYFSTTFIMASICFSMDSTRAICVRVRSRLCSGRLILKYVSPSK